MFNKKRLIVLVTFLAALFFMTMYAGGGEENAPIATRVVKFIDGYNDAEISTQNVNLGEEATKPADPEHRNLLFSGWFSGDNRVTDFTNIMENLTVISRYVDDINNNGIADSDETPFIVTFYDTIASTNIRVVSVLPGMNATAPTAPEHDGYTFNGWSTSYRNVTEDRTINTIYISELATETTHTVRFLVDGEELSSQEIANGASASEPSAPKKEKLVFVRWDTSFDNVTSDLTINAVYADDINENGKADADENKFTIRFETNGNGTFTGETSFTGLLEGLKVYDFIELPEYEANPGYTFIGWDRELPEDDAVITDSFVYTAIFKDITKPEVIVSDIVDGQFNPEKFTFNAKDPNGIFSLSYTIRPKGEKDSVQSGYIKYQDILDDLTKTYSINELPAGEYELRISIRDVAENPNHGSVINFIVDNTNPTLEDVVINKNITNENSIEISGKIFDENIKYTSIRIFNSLNESVLQKTVSGNYDGLIENLDISTFDDDTYRVRLKVYDLAGNTEQINKTLVIDRTAPSKPTITARNDYQAGTWTNETVILDFTSTDFLTSSENLRYESTTSPVLHPDSWKAIENPAEFKVNVYNNVYVRAIDEAGNISDYSDFFQVKVDKNKPNAPVIDTNGYISGTWTREDVKLNASGSESPYANESKVKYQFRYNEENSWQDFDSVWFNTNYNVKVTFRAIDEAGNISDDSETIQVLIDKSAPNKPTITARNDYQAGTWINETVILDFTSTDNVTKSENLRYESTTSPVLHPDSWKAIENPAEFKVNVYNNVYVRAIDEAGNISDYSDFFQVKVDKNKPNAPVIDTNGYISGTWTREDVKLNASGSESPYTNESKVKYQFRYNEENSWQDFDSVWFNTNYNVKVTFRAIDEAGNISDDSETIQVLIDKDAPETPKITAINGYPGWIYTNEDVTLNFTSIDNVTSSENLRYEYNTSTSETGWRSITNPRTFNTDIYNNVYVRAIDETGNKSEISKFFQVKVDKTNPNKPVITNSSEGLLTNENITISWNATDVAVGTAISGISHYEYSFDEETWEVTDEQNMTFAESIVTEMFIRAVDNAGNKSSTSSTTINLNKKLITYSTSYSPETPTNIAVAATIKFNAPVTVPVNLEDIWLPVANCHMVKTRMYCKEWKQVYFNNTEEQPEFTTEDGRKSNPVVTIDKIDRNLNRAVVTKNVAADEKSVLVTLTADEEIIVESSGWTQTSTNVWKKTYTENNLFGNVIYRDLAGNYILLEPIIIYEIKRFSWFNTAEPTNEFSTTTDEEQSTSGLSTISEENTLFDETTEEAVIKSDEPEVIETTEENI